jgi:predicted Zn-dependent protease
VVLTAFALAVPPLPAQAQKRGGGVPLIRDAEIEQLLREYTAPIFRAAGLSKANLKIILINDKSFNAFVVDGRRIFVNTGALADSTTPNQIIGVLAHETGHIAGGGRRRRCRRQYGTGRHGGSLCQPARRPAHPALVSARA